MYKWNIKNSWNLFKSRRNISLKETIWQKKKYKLVTHWSSKHGPEGDHQRDVASIVWEKQSLLLLSRKILFHGYWYISIFSKPQLDFLFYTLWFPYWNPALCGKSNVCFSSHVMCFVLIVGLFSTFSQVSNRFLFPNYDCHSLEEVIIASFPMFNTFSWLLVFFLLFQSLNLVSFSQLWFP